MEISERGLTLFRISLAIGALTSFMFQLQNVAFSISVTNHFKKCLCKTVSYWKKSTIQPGTILLSWWETVGFLTAPPPRRRSLCAGPGGACGSVVRGLCEEEEQEHVCLLPGAGGGRGVFRGVGGWGVSAGGGPDAPNAWPQRLEGIGSKPDNWFLFRADAGDTHQTSGC